MLAVVAAPTTRRRPVRPTPAEERAWRGLLYATRSVRRRVFDVIARASGLSEPDFEVLVTLFEAPQRTMRSSELAAAVNWDRSRLSHHAARLEKRGLIAREPCPGDNRAARFRMTTEGAAAIRRATVPHYRTVTEFFAQALTAEQIASLTEITEALLDHLARVDADASSVGKP